MVQYFGGRRTRDLASLSTVRKSRSHGSSLQTHFLLVSLLTKILSLQTRALHRTLGAVDFNAWKLDWKSKLDD